MATCVTASDLVTRIKHTSGANVTILFINEAVPAIPGLDLLI